MSTAQAHLDDAAAVLTDSESYPYHSPEALTAASMVSARAALAQARATLELAEVTKRLAAEQRTANLIAYVAMRDQMIRDADPSLSLQARINTLMPHIEERLGL